VRDKVRSDTRATPADQPRQNPVFCCPEKNEMVLSIVDTQSTTGGGNAYKRRNLLQVDALIKSSILAVFSKANEAGADDQPIASLASRDSLFDHYYKLFTEAISKKALIAPKGSSAVDYLDLLLPLAKDPLVKEDLQDELVAALMNEAQTGITNYGRPPILDTVDALNYDFFNDRALLLDAALKYSVYDETLRKEITAKKLVLEARALAEQGENDELALAKVDSSLSIMNSSYGNHTKGLLLSEMDKKEEAIQYFDKAAGPGKKWAYPLSAKGDVYSSGGNYDSAIFYYKSALSINPVNDNTVFKLGVAYQEKGQYDSSIVYLQKASNIRTKSLGKQNYNSANTLNYLARAYDKKGDNATAEILYNQAIDVYKKMPRKAHRYYANTLTNLARLYDKMGKNNVAKPLYQEAAIMKPPPRKPRPDHTGQKAPYIDAEGMAKLLSGIPSGKTTAEDFKPYLCGRLRMMVIFNTRSMTFAEMCQIIRDKGKDMSTPKLRLTKDPTTNCIIGMDVTVKRKPSISNEVNLQPSSSTLKNNATKTTETTPSKTPPPLNTRESIRKNL
jgi:tetratricopeptide (TPR) repeat protein